MQNPTPLPLNSPTPVTVGQPQQPWRFFDKIACGRENPVTRTAALASTDRDDTYGHKTSLWTGSPSGGVMISDPLDPHYSALLSFFISDVAKVATQNCDGDTANIYLFGVRGEVIPVAPNSNEEATPEWSAHFLATLALTAGTKLVAAGSRWRPRGTAYGASFVDTITITEDCSFLASITGGKQHEAAVLTNQIAVQAVPHLLGFNRLMMVVGGLGTGRTLQARLATA